jgi:hypothetical protein
MSQYLNTKFNLIVPIKDGYVDTIKAQCHQQ